MAGDEEPPKNPFIRWKQHVDSNISTTLQGIVGLPSAVSRNLSTRDWPEVEEARRKELEKQQQQQQQPSQQDAEPQTTVATKETPDEATSTFSSRESNDPHHGWSVHLFTPRDRAFHCPHMQARNNGFGPSSGNGDGSDQDPSSVGGPNDPNSWTAWPDWVQMARWHSFAAYSPYSPLNLRNMPQPRPLDLPAGEQSNLTFEDAFEDLLAVMCARELTAIKEKNEMRRVLRNMFPSGEPAFYWVRRLQSQGLLNGYFPRADQVRRQLEEQHETAMSEEEAQRRRELEDRRGRMWKWVWSRHHPMKEEDKKAADADVKSFEEWDPEEWVKEMDSILSQAAKDVRSELNKDGHIFGELERLFKSFGRVGEAFSGFGDDDKPSRKEQRREEPKAEEPETEEEYFSAIAKASGSASASTSASTSTGADAHSSFDTRTRVFTNPDGSVTTWSTSSDDTPHSASSVVSRTTNDTTNSSTGKRVIKTTEESVDPSTGIKTIRTREENVDRNGNRSVRTEVKQLNSEGDEISRQSNYSKSMSKSWSWSSGGGNGSNSAEKPPKPDDGQESWGSWLWRR